MGYFLQVKAQSVERSIANLCDGEDEIFDPDESRD